MAMAISPDVLTANLSYLGPATPRPWEPGSAPGFYTDTIPLEEPGSSAWFPGAIQGYRASYEQKFSEDDGAVTGLTIDIVLASNPVDMEESLIAEIAEVANDVGGVLESLESSTDQRYLLTVTDDSANSGTVVFAVGVSVDTIDDVVVSVTVTGTNDVQVEDILNQAVLATGRRVRDVLGGKIGYGRLDNVTSHSRSASWTQSEGLSDGQGVTVEGSYVEASGSTCSVSLNPTPFPLELDFDSDGHGFVSLTGVRTATSLGAWPQFGTCGIAYPGLPAYFAVPESRSVNAFLRDVPDLGETMPTHESINGIEAVRFDISQFYQAYLDRFSADLSVDRFDLWLHANDGWVVGFSVKVGGSSEDLAQNGFGGPFGSDSDVSTTEFRVTGADDATIEVKETEASLVGPPGGATVVFASERVGNTRDIYIMTPTGEVTILTSHPNGDELPALSPDGTTIAFVSRRTGNDSIFLMKVDGSDLRRLTAPITDGGDSWPSWSPDGRSIVFGSDRELGGDDLWIIDADGTGLRMLFDDPDQSDLWPAWSPSGDVIAFVSTTADRTGSNVYMVRPDGTGLTQVTSESATRYTRPSWSPDGSRLLVTADQDGRSVMYLMDADGSNRVVVDSAGVSGGFGVFTPDGEQIVFTDGTVLWTVRLDGSALRRLTTHPLPDTVPATGIASASG
jgi:hypothetical protein